MLTLSHIYATPGLKTNRSPPVITDAPSESHRWTTEVASAAFAVANGGPPIIPLVVTECSIGGHRWKLINTPLATDGSTGNKSVTIPSWYPCSMILGLIPSQYMVSDLILSGKSI